MSGSINLFQSFMSLTCIQIHSYSKSTICTQYFGSHSEMLGCYILGAQVICGLAVEAWSPFWDIVIPLSRIEASRTCLWEFCQSIRRTNIGLSVGYKTQIQEQFNIRSEYWCISVLVLPAPGKEIVFIKVALSGQKLTQGSWLWSSLFLWSK